MLLTVVSFITLVALGVYMFSKNQSAQDFARIVTGGGAILWAVLLLIPTIR